MSNRLKIASDIMGALLTNNELRMSLLYDCRNTRINTKNLNLTEYMVEYAYEIADELIKQE